MTNDEVMRRYSDAYLSGDPEAVAAMYTDDVVTHVGAATLRGRETLFAWLAANPAHITEVHDLLGGRTHGAAFVSLADGRRRVVVYRIEDGRFSEAWVFDG